VTDDFDPTLEDVNVARPEAPKTTGQFPESRGEGEPLKATVSPRKSRRAHRDSDEYPDNWPDAWEFEERPALSSPLKLRDDRSLVERSRDATPEQRRVKAEWLADPPTS